MNKNILLWVAFLIGLVSCNSEPDRRLLSNITGKAGELVVVINKKDWQASLGDTIRKYMGKPVPGLPQYEPFFDLISIAPDNFSNMFKTHRNLLILDKSTNAEEPAVEFKKNMWAQHQASIRISGCNSQMIANKIAEKHEVIETFFLNAEINRTLRHYKNNQKVELTNELSTKHHVSLIIPTGYNMDMDTNNFVWISHETPRISQGIFIYYYDYRDTATFTMDYLINKRNEICKKYVAGPYPGSYMGTDTANTIYFREYMKNDQYFAMIKGLWKLENKGYMGGPFVSLSTVDEKRGRVVTAEGYVFASGKEKRNYIRQLETILHTLEIKKTDQ